MPHVGVNGPTVFTRGGELARIERGAPYGPGGGVLRGDRVSLPAGGPIDHAEPDPWAVGLKP